MKEETKRIVKCPHCGKEKEIYRYQWKRSKTGLFFCDNKCSGQYYSKEHPVKICKICGQEKHSKNGICDNQVIMRRSKNLERLGFDLSSIGTNRVFEEYEKLKDNLYDLYYNKKLSCKDIIQQYGIANDRNMDSLFNLCGIKRRNLSEARYNALKTNKSIMPQPNNDGEIIRRMNFRHGWHTSWEGNEIYYRSSYELDYMKALDEAKVSYQGENYLKFEYYDTQMQKMRIALPDFYLPESNTIVEIKSCFTYNPQNMIDKVKAYKEAGYNFKLILDHKETDI